MPNYVYRTCCVNSTAKLINEMIEEGQEVTLATFRRHCQGVSEWAQSMGYETDKRRGLTLANDWHVRYYKSRYKGKPCYFIRHSAIEYIWVKA